MLRFLAITRRFFLGGIISLIVSLFLGVDILEVLLNFIPINNFVSLFKVYLIFSPVLYILFVLISVVYIRHFGQFYEIHREKTYFQNIAQCFGSDLCSPFKNIFGFFGALFNKNAMGKGILIFRFIELLLLITFCVIGVLIII